ncbi:MAG: hypothetical protein VB086_09320 [Clostridiaceae bacterium]|nr:hypothetical protein [Clostridiaceae bacterium]
MTEITNGYIFTMTMQGLMIIVFIGYIFDMYCNEKMTAECYERKYGMINKKCHCSYCPNRFACQHYEYPKKSQWFRHLIQRFQKKEKRGQ